MKCKMWICVSVIEKVNNITLNAIAIKKKEVIQNWIQHVRMSHQLCINVTWSQWKTSFYCIWQLQTHWSRIELFCAQEEAVSHQAYITNMRSLHWQWTNNHSSNWSWKLAVSSDNKNIIQKTSTLNIQISKVQSVNQISKELWNSYIKHY